MSTTVGDLMTPHAVSLAPDATIQSAAKLMRDDIFGAVPIVDSNNALVGIVTDRDIVVKAIAEGRGLDTPVSDIMTRNPQTAPRDATIEQAMRIMAAAQIRRIPVVESGRLIGMLSIGDIATTVPDTSVAGTVLEHVSERS
ncbi:CBS domain-containing protein [Capsulimonas corticalis]|uniref:CBS domain-containing protein n=1 Tax=Capsulimonas corticalis TaxID=2219043 RepID=A0A402D4T6_9BACT|nr:CBS domain-containing protein [Capsulimonas corticalis]BDI29254.1 CBS domain-containing protein [Capsulimonas corticalis]